MTEETKNIRDIIQSTIQEFLRGEQSRAEPGYKSELAEERRRRESLEHRVNELVAENERARAKAEQAERSSAIRAELQRLGVSKLDLAYRAVQDEIVRGDDGRLVSQDGTGIRDYLTRFVGDNPELLPARLAGGSGASAGSRGASGQGTVDVEKIKPGMNPEDLERVRQEIARVASQTLRGL